MRLLAARTMLGGFLFILPFVSSAESAAPETKSKFELFSEKLAITRPVVKELVDNASRKYPLFSILSIERPEFRKFWEDKLVLDQVKNDIQTTDIKVLEIGAGMALIIVQAHYLARADDESTNAYLAAASTSLSTPGSGGASCKSAPDDADKDSVPLGNSSSQEKGDVLYLEKMIGLMNAIVTGSRNRDISILTRSEMKKSSTTMLVTLEKTHGAQAVLDFLQLNSERLGPAERCRNSAWAMEAMLTMPQHERAILGRTLFSYQGQDMMKGED